ncbi:hypothetical protein KUCAC02_013127 [Chaenocephalus aceratus]|uniref:Uncharacterized protein n=1 Tax=Chaenocephalus aceratus TaxID=36190 RepID=A0ACB9XDC8_CHAAC|nr:hypothetical protein KUCAC02_013127 [Chaenocephalus aceratus]
MGECLRKACPCLETLWQRIFCDKKPPPGAEGGGEGGGSSGGEGGGGGSSMDGTGGVGGSSSDGTGGSSPPSPAPGSGSGSMFRALWSFESRHPDELSFQEGDLFSVISRTGDWWTARRIDKNGRVLDTGVVPKNYLDRAESLQTQPWFFGTMNRIEAQSHLMGTGNDLGAFLIRHSEKDHVGYVLSVKVSFRVKHFKVHTENENNFYIEHNHLGHLLIDLLGNPCKRKKPPTTDLSHFTVDEWELPKDEFTLLEELGSGYFADVYRVRWKNHINVAIKILKSDSEMNHREFQREVQDPEKPPPSSPHLSVCHLHASAPYYIITELMEKGSLLNFLRGPEGHNQDLAALIDIGAQVADGMSYLEKNNSIHRDLAARNVLVGEDYICKVADFGLARVIKEPFYITEDKKSPYKWSAPEASAMGSSPQIITYGGTHYPAFNNQEVYEQVSNGYRMSEPSNCPNLLYKIMLQCWSFEPDDRPDFKTVKTKLDSSFYELE